MSFHDVKHSILEKISKSFDEIEKLTDDISRENYIEVIKDISMVQLNIQSYIQDYVYASVDSLELDPSEEIKK